MKRCLSLLLLLPGMLCAANSLQFPGVVKPSIDFELTATQGGIITFDTEEGAILQKGAPVAHVEPTAQRLELQMGEASVRESTTSYEQAVEQMEADQNLLAKGSIAAKAAQKSLKSAYSAKARLDRESASFALKKRNLEETMFPAPVGAILVEKLVKDYSTVKKGEKIARLMDGDLVEVEIFPSYTHYTSLKVGQKVSVTQEGKTQVGKVVYVAPNVDTTTQTFRAKIEVNNLSNAEVVDGFERFHFVPGSVVQVCL